MAANQISGFIGPVYGRDHLRRTSGERRRRHAESRRAAHGSDDEYACAGLRVTETTYGIERVLAYGALCVERQLGRTGGSRGRENHAARRGVAVVALECGPGKQLVPCVRRRAQYTCGIGRGLGIAHVRLYAGERRSIAILQYGHEIDAAEIRPQHQNFRLGLAEYFSKLGAAKTRVQSNHRRVQPGARQKTDVPGWHIGQPYADPVAALYSELGECLRQLPG